jgi:hypothetical protein
MDTLPAGNEMIALPGGTDVSMFDMAIQELGGMGIWSISPGKTRYRLEFNT